MSEEKLFEERDGRLYVNCRMCLKLETGGHALGMEDYGRIPKIRL